ncbi:response regulator transcription factor [Paenibacillus arenilitoris]|uniref:Response regulator transcription factor n=1 Tax=Paenibacillus arenilitoris TaxID=2772299 RepID=A0A927H9H4_9BACL|nr:response regulator transcription factor [Paenibacillus arenilitoris]MBD2871609.1 response regulator transcription factor [Paenibacillus arenilitoris]
MTLQYCKVLIVDDEVLIRQGIKHFMNWEQEGFHIVGEASNGKEALERIRELRPHIVLTDIVMPVMDGEELTKQIKLLYPEIEVIVLSSFGEFDYVRSTFQSGVADYILKPKLDMQHLLAVLKLTADKIPGLRPVEAESGYRFSPDRLMESMLSGYTAEYEEEEIRAVFPHPWFCLFGVSLQGLRERWLAGYESLTQQVEKKIESRLPGAAYRLLPTGENVAALLLNVERGGLDGLPGLAREIAGIAANAAPETALAVSEPFAEFSRLGAVYRDSLLKLLDYAFFLPGKRVLIDNELPEPQPAPESFHLNRFTDEFKRERFGQAFADLRGHVRAMAGNYKTDVFEFKSFLGNLIFNMTVLLSNMGYDVKELEKNKYAYFKAIEDARSADEAIAKLEAFIAEAGRSIEGRAAHAGNANMKRLLDYIDEHYAEPLSLTEMAKHFHFNPSYLSSYFSTHHDEGFIDYLHRVRTEKAAELLRSGEATISEISGMVGYSDHSYFTKVFKKLTGLSPSRYRRQYMK